MCDFNSEAVVNNSVVIALYLISCDLGALAFLFHDRNSPLLRMVLPWVLMLCFADLHTKSSLLRWNNLGGRSVESVSGRIGWTMGTWLQIERE